MDKKERKSFKEYDAKLQNLEGILRKVCTITDVEKYYDELEEIKRDLKDANVTRVHTTNTNMQFDFEMHLLSPFIKRIDDLTQKVSDDLLSFYEIHLLSIKIKDGLKTVNEKSIIEIIESTRRMISLMNQSVTHNNPDLEKILKDAYAIIYQVMLHETIFNRSDIFTSVLAMRNDTFDENIGRLLAEDLDELPEKMVLDETLKGIRKEGLGYDYLTLEIVREVAQAVLGKESKAISERKEKEEIIVKDKIHRLNSLQWDLHYFKNEKAKSVRNLLVNIGEFLGRTTAFALIPAVSFAVGEIIGTNASNQIDEYKTVTRTVNPITKNVIGEESFVYDEHETTYVATVEECSPWRRNPLGTGYVRDVVTYEYVSTDNEEFTVDNVSKAVMKYRYVEAKDCLDEDDSLTDVTYQVTETYQDKNDSRKSRKYIIPGIILGGLVGFGLDVALYFLGRDRFRDLGHIMDEIKRNQKSISYCKDDINDALKRLVDEAKSVEQDYNKVIEVYGSYSDKESVETLRNILLASRSTKVKSLK